MDDRPSRLRFQKAGQGIPADVRRAHPTSATALARTLKEPVVITEQGRKKTITKFEAAVKQLVNKAASGEARAIAQLLALVQVVESQVDAHDPATQPLPEADQHVMARILRRPHPSGTRMRSHPWP